MPRPDGQCVRRLVVATAAPDCSDAAPARRYWGATLFGRGMPRPDGQ